MPGSFTASAMRTTAPDGAVTGSSRRRRSPNSARIPRLEQTQQGIPGRSSGTLGDVLYPDKSKAREPEQAWVRLVRSVAAGDQLALHALYERAHRPVFTLIVRITANREIAEDLTLEVFRDVWWRASAYDPAQGTVLAWIMSQARYRAVDSLPSAAPAAAADVLGSRKQSSALRAALVVLRPDERDAIEAAFFAGTTTTGVRSGLHKLRQALAAGNGEATPALDRNYCEQSELTCAYALMAVPSSQMSAAEQHIFSCPECQRELAGLRPVVDAMASWPSDVLRPSPSLKERLARRMAAETGRQPVLPVAPQWSEPDWEEVAPGISCKLLATDAEKHRVSMLVRLAPDTSYPPHTHAGVEELHLLDGELWIEERKLLPGDYNLAQPGTGDQRVWSETGCACVLVTSTRDILR
jgi:DNA-directed RNA polymerase specialized sigma24 family protein/quercetin dioxygenase-like cupin family protein